MINMTWFSLKEKLFTSKDLIQDYKSQISELKEYNRILTEKTKRNEEEIQELKQVVLKYDMQNKEVLLLKHTQENFNRLHREVVQSQLERIQELKGQNKVLVTWKPVLEEQLQMKDKQADEHLLEAKTKLKEAGEQAEKMVQEASEQTNKVLAEKEFDLKNVNREIENAAHQWVTLKQNIKLASTEAEEIIVKANEKAKLLLRESQEEVAQLEKQVTEKNKRKLEIEEKLKRYDVELEYYQTQISELLNLTKKETKEKEA